MMFPNVYVRGFVPTHLVVHAGPIRPLSTDRTGPPSCCELFVSLTAQRGLGQSSELGVEGLPDEYGQRDESQLLIDWAKKRSQRGNSR